MFSDALPVPFGILDRLVRVLAAFVLLVGLTPAPLRGQERPVVSLGQMAQAEVRQQGFTLSRPMKVHVFARGGGVRFWWDGEGGTRLFASGWILDATTREVVWQMGGAHCRRQGGTLVDDQYLDLPAGSYEAYFSNYGFGEDTLFSGWIRNVDRRKLHGLVPPGPGHHSLLGILGLSREGVEREWLRQVGQYGLQVAVPASEAEAVTTFPAPLRWGNILFSLAATGDEGHWTQAFRLRKPTTLHLYAEGEASGDRMVDTGWIQEVRSRKRVWEMRAGVAKYAGGAGKNRRQVETLQLPAGDYVATFVTDDSHSPADWNAAPPCDPGMYGLTLSVPSAAELASATLIPEPAPGPVLAQLVRVTDDQDLRADFTLARAQEVRVYAIGERDGDDMADGAWIEDAGGKTVWRMEAGRTQHAGGARKNRLVDEVVALGAGRYTLRVRTDDSHAYGDWNADRPWDPEHYGATVYALK